MIRKVVLKNFKRFDNVEIAFTKGLNVIVGDNEAGKSTLLEAINLGLTKRSNGKFFESEFSHHFITRSVADAFVLEARSGNRPRPPEVVVEVFLEDQPEVARLKGTNNSLTEDAPGYRLQAKLDPDFESEYNAFLDESDEVTTVPTEYYRVEWTDFAGQPVNVRALRVKSSLIDASRIRLHSGAEYHLQKIIGETLDIKQRAQLARRYRLHQEDFGANASIQAVNDSLGSSSADMTDKSFTMEIDTSGAYGWESSLSPHLDKLPFHFSGSGEQNRLKILLALARKVEDSHVILIEEPENHLSFSHLNRLVASIEAQSKDRQVIIATHSSFVVNKLGLDQLMLLGEGGASRLTDLPDGTQDYFMKLSGYDTLRLVLAQKAVIVEGPSDELIFQRAYRDRFQRRPIEDGIDVINVRGLSAKRFLDLAIPLKRRTVVLADNDGDYANKVDRRYTAYTQHDFVVVARSDNDSRPSLEQQLVGSQGLQGTNTVLGTNFTDENALIAHMQSDKTEAALLFHDTSDSVTWPSYIEEAIDALA